MKPYVHQRGATAQLSYAHDRLQELLNSKPDFGNVTFVRSVINDASTLIGENWKPLAISADVPVNTEAWKQVVETAAQYIME